MKRELNIDTWERKEHYNFFKGFEEPFWAIVVNLDCTNAYLYCKENGLSFFIYYLYQSLKVANKIAPFKHRIIDDKVIEFDVINGSITTLRANKTFGFSHLDYFDDFLQFQTNAKKEIEKTKNTTGLNLSPPREDVIHYTSTPWAKFTSVSHPKKSSSGDSLPKIVFGKMTDNHAKKEMPVSIQVHHALVDGFHVGKYIEAFQLLLNNNKPNW